MFNKYVIGKSVTDLESSEQFSGYSKVIVQISDEISYEAGSDTGRTMTLNCPWGTQEMADNILKSIMGYQYQPYNASGAIIDPSAEVGDAVQVNDVYGGIYDTSISFGHEFRVNISAPSDEEVDESVPYKSRTDRIINRQKTEMNAQLAIQAGLISAKVSRTGGEDSSFGWELDEKSWTLKSNGATVLTADKSGLEINGIIRATGGEIGGFTIEKNHLSYNGQTWGGTNTYGAYIGTNGIQIGKNFKVDMAGNLEAASGKFSGAVNAGSIQFGGEAGYLSGSGLSGKSVAGAKILDSTLDTAKFTNGVNTTLAYADFANGAFNGWNPVNALTVAEEKLKIGDHTLRLATRIDSSGKYNYVTWY